MANPKRSTAATITIIVFLVVVTIAFFKMGQPPPATPIKPAFIDKAGNLIPPKPPAGPPGK